MFFGAKKSVGLDIADHTIEAVEIQKGRKLRLLKMSRIKLEPGIVERGRIKDKKKLAEAIKKLFKEAKEQPIITKKVIFGLPESQVYIQVLELPKGADIKEEAKKNIPLKEEDLLFSYKNPLLIAASKEVVLEWQGFFKGLGIEVELFDIESLATFRGLLVPHPSEARGAGSKLAKGPTCLVDIGTVTTNIAVFGEKGLRYSHSINVAGDAFTNEIAEALKIKPEEAEAQKIKLGLSDKDSQIFSALVKPLEKISKEVKVALKYFEEVANQKVEEIVLVGGSSKLQGIVDYFKSNLETHPIRDSGDQKKTEEEKISNGVKVRLGESVLRRIGLPTEYTEAIGLALRGVDKQYEKDPVFAPIKIKASVGKPVAKPIKKAKQAKEAVPANQKLRKQKTLLVIVLIIGLVIVGLAYWYRSSEKAKKEAEIEKMKEQQQAEESTEIVEEEPEIIEEEVLTVIIKQTETGWLNVRKGPGTGYPILIKIYPGESYELLEESGNWYKIRVENEEGWIFNKYANKQ